MAGIKRYNDRLSLCHALREALPEASIVCGARHHSFITLDRGESVHGQSGFDADGKPKSEFGVTSVWSRPPIGKRYIEWAHERGRDRIVVREHEQVPVHMMARYATAERSLAIIVPPVDFGREHWLREAVQVLVGAFREWIRPVASEDIERQLRTGERFEVRIHKLDPMPEPKARREAVRR